ncbi:MAG: imidazoleglycerol-phosphate dehydratase HisB [Spirochaetes bacterium]|nr:imidazoleglycerol-phosphate dehydratase HisB [Spirochaetota bacterium]
MRKVTVERKTKETNIKLGLNLDGEGRYKVNTPAGFFNHMLESFCKHGLFDIEIEAAGDTEVDFHHLVEDVGICLGQALDKALAKREKINRFGWAVVPMDEALVMSSIDISGRPLLVYDVDIKKQKVGEYDTELTEEFLKALSDNAKLCLHVRLLNGANAHHTIEAIFKSISKSLKAAVSINPLIKGVLSTKDVI